VNPLAMLGIHPPLATAAKRAQEREERVHQIAILLACHDWAADRCFAEARRAVELAERVGLEEAQSSPVALASHRVDDYIDDVHDTARRGELLPRTAEELRAIPEAVRRRAVDVARVLGFL
jgi:hypothetical protein